MQSLSTNVTTYSTLNSALMIQVRALQGAVPVEMFLRAARELSAVAADVGQTLNPQRPGDLRSHQEEAAPSLLETNGTGGGVSPPLSEGTAGWRIVRVESSGNISHSVNGGAAAGTQAARADGLIDLGNTAGQSVALVIAPPLAQRDAVHRVREGVRSIQSGDPQRPEGFSDAALRSLRRAAALSGRQLRITLSSGQGEGEAVPLDAAVVTQIDSWLEGQRHAIGSVEGQLDVISVHNRLRFTIYGAHGERVECLFEDGLLPQVKSALGERVGIRGRVHYRKDGVPASVEVQWLRRLRPASELPTLQTLVSAQRLW